MNKMKKILLLTILVIIAPLSRVMADDGITTALPEPSTILFLGFTIAALGFYLYWRSKKRRR
ncbi:MAG: PEP-CTERM sorting domain-containing protein [Deltaproteobacteria bacterium]|nr:PEP-CTERM sorting domain-containing protein [Deltaproteobacteria bacterium]